MTCTQMKKSVKIMKKTRFVNLSQIMKMMTMNMLNNDEHACAYEKHKHCDK